MEPKGYELLKIEAKIDGLEKELSAIFADFKKYELKKEAVIENAAYKKLEKMNVCVPECPVDAIISDTEDENEKWLKINQQY